MADKILWEATLTVAKEDEDNIVAAHNKTCRDEQVSELRDALACWLTDNPYGDLGENETPDGVGDDVAMRLECAGGSTYQHEQFDELADEFSPYLSGHVTVTYYTDESERLQFTRDADWERRFGARYFPALGGDMGRFVVKALQGGASGDRLRAEFDAALAEAGKGGR